MDTFRRELARFEAGQVALGFQVADRAGYEQQVLDLLIEQELIRQLGATQGIVVIGRGSRYRHQRADHGERWRVFQRLACRESLHDG